MKNAFFLMIAVIMMASCVQQNPEEKPFDKWNGYGKYLKYGDITVDLKAAQHDVVGHVTYGLTDEFDPDNGYFYVIYQLNAGYTMTESHVYAGLKENMPLTVVKKGTPGETGSPKIGLFPYGATYSTPVNADTFYIDCQLLPDVNPGFVVASHCVVKGPGNYKETGWAWGDTRFTDKSWGMYYTYSYEVPSNKFTVLYGTSYINDYLQLYHLDVTNGITTLILKEYVGDNMGRFDGAAYDDATRNFYFSNYTTGELYVNNLNDEEGSTAIGVLFGTPASGTFFNNAYYYVNEEANTINKVTFNSDNYIASEVILDTIPSAVVVNDITFNPDGESLYLLGEINGGGRQLITWDVSDKTFFAMDITVNSGAQMAYGSDGQLYVIAPITEGGSHSLTYTLNPQSGTLTQIPDDVIIIDDPFSDLSTGPIM
jgi:hypothetical protein